MRAVPPVVRILVVIEDVFLVDFFFVGHEAQGNEKAGAHIESRQRRPE
jgi:hypothetical protein